MNKNLQIRVLLSTIFFLILFISNNTEVIAQNLYEMNSYILSEKGKQDSNYQKSDYNLEDLYFNYQKSIDLSVDEAFVNQELQPIVVNVDLSQVAKLYVDNKQFENAKLLVIRIGSKNENRVDLTKLIGFKNLQYIVFRCESNCNSQSLLPLIISTTEMSFDLIYYISIPE